MEQSRKAAERQSARRVTLYFKRFMTYRISPLTFRYLSPNVIVHVTKLLNFVYNTRTRKHYDIFATPFKGECSIWIIELQINIQHSRKSPFNNHSCVGSTAPTTPKLLRTSVKYKYVGKKFAIFDPLSSFTSYSFADPLCARTPI